MKATFVETTGFTEAILDFMPDRGYAEIQQRLMTKPDLGDVMPGCGGLRKLRAADPTRQKGKRGGVRIIYLHVPVARRFYLLDIYGKDEKDDLSATEKRQLRNIAEQLKREAIASYHRFLKGRK